MSEPRDLAVQDDRQSTSLITAILAAAKDPGVDADKVKTMADLAVSLQDRELASEFSRAKAAAISEMPVVTKSGVIVIRDRETGRERQQGKFAKFEDIYRVVRPILERNNLALSFDIAERQGGGITVTPILTHANGYTERGGGMPLPADQSGGKNAVQAVGSASQYGKRYTMCAMLMIVTEGVDDDGNLGRTTAVSLPFEREQLVDREAREAAAAGRYLDWYFTQSPKDRGWLVASGLHAELGGGAALPEPKPEKLVVEDRPEPEPEPTGRGPKRTPLQMVEDFEARLKECKTSREVADLQGDEKVRKFLDGLQGKDRDLFERASQALATRYSTLVAAERSGEEERTLV